MTNREIMEKATKYTTEVYKQVNYSTKVQSGRITYEGLKNYALDYSAEVLMKVINSGDGICTDYPKRDNIREDIASIGKNGLINELLKNIVNVAAYQRIKGTKANEELGCSISQGMSDEQKAVILFNNLFSYDPAKMYELLDDPDIMHSVCRSFAKYRNKEFKDVMDYIAGHDLLAEYHNDELQTYYESLEAEKVKSLK